MDEHGYVYSHPTQGIRALLSQHEHYCAGQIKKLRLGSKASQVVFATNLNTNPITVKKWAQGEKQPNGLSLRQLDFVDH